MTPARPRVDHLLEHRKAFERDAEGALDAIQIHQGQRLLAEEGAIHSNLSLLVDRQVFDLGVEIFRDSDDSGGSHVPYGADAGGAVSG